MFETFKTCMPCSRIRDEFCAGFQEVREVVSDCLGFDYTEVVLEDKE